MSVYLVKQKCTLRFRTTPPLPRYAVHQTHHRMAYTSMHTEVTMYKDSTINVSRNIKSKSASRKYLQRSRPQGTATSTIYANQVQTGRGTDKERLRRETKKKSRQRKIMDEHLVAHQHILRAIFVASICSRRYRNRLKFDDYTSDVVDHWRQFLPSTPCKLNQAIGSLQWIPRL